MDERAYRLTTMRRKRRRLALGWWLGLMNIWDMIDGRFLRYEGGVLVIIFSFSVHLCIISLR